MAGSRGLPDVDLVTARPRVVPSDALDERTRRAMRGLLDDAFAGEFSDDDWAHALGGSHVIVEAHGAIVAHGSVVPRIVATTLIISVGTFFVRGPCCIDD